MQISELRELKKGDSVYSICFSKIGVSEGVSQDFEIFYTLTEFKLKGVAAGEVKEIRGSDKKITPFDSRVFLLVVKEFEGDELLELALGFTVDIYTMLKLFFIDKESCLFSLKEIKRISSLVKGN